MKLLLAILFLVAAHTVRAQTVANTSNMLHPLTKNSGQRNAPSSLDQDPSMNPDLRTANPARPTPLPPAKPGPAKPAEIIARIDAGLAASTISLLGTVSGLKGRLYVTNMGSQEITPFVQFAVCNQKGFQIGTAAKTGQALAPNDAERIEVVATNLSAVDLKLMRLTAARK